MTTPIPQPPSIPFVGNITSIDKEVPINGFMLLAKQYGEIYQLNILGRTVVHLNTHALINEVSDDKRFKKLVGGALFNVRKLVGDGLFTAQNDEHNWGLAHRLLMPAFSTMAIRDMLEDMRDLCDQLLLKWERFGPDHVIDPSDDLTRVALDTIALCSMSYRLNSFYTENQPEFARAMVDFLKECFSRTQRPSIVQALMSGTNAKWEADVQFMTDIADKIVNQRKENPIEKKDLLNIMLNGKDPKTGEGLSDDVIVKNLLTFLIAGHETSSGMMSFMTYYLIKNPHIMRRLQAEVDEVLGGEPAQIQDLSKMPYLTAVMRETLRLTPTAPVRVVAAVEDTTLLNGKYFVKAGTPLAIHAWLLHRDPAVWGEDAQEFRPERMMDGKFEALPPNSWQPFGFGMRACIGRPFAWQEVQLVMASIVQKFDLEFVDPSYTLELKQALTVKPKDLYIKAKLRSTRPRLFSAPRVQAKRSTSAATQEVPALAANDRRIPMYLLYGSNTGTSEAFAQRIANDAARYGFAARLGSMDSSTGKLPTDGPVVILTASYEGQPADNAARFFDWLSSLQGEELKDVKYAVFGSGHSDWVQTYHRIPKFVDEIIEQRGGSRLLPRGAGDSGKADFFEVFDEFVGDLWQCLTKEYNTAQLSSSVSSGFEAKTVDAGTGRSEALRQVGTGLGKVIENRVLTKPGHPVKRHIEFELPEGSTYRTGDYLAILPQNPNESVHRVLAFFNLSNEQQIIISSTGPTSLPTDKPVSLFEILSGYVELSQPATKHDIRALIEMASSDEARSYLQDLASSYQTKALGPRLSVMDIVEKHPEDIKLSLGAFLRMLPPMRVRQYSISSSPLWNPEHATLTISVLDSPSISDSSKTFLGVGSNYLARLIPGDRVQMAVRPSAAAFHPPEDPTVPIVAYCAGSGLAPIRGFIQERAMQKSSGRDVGKILLFFGCRSPDVDLLYGEDDLLDWEKLGVVDVRPAFSRETEKSKGCKYVQDRLWHDRTDVIAMYQNNANFYICGSSHIAREVKAKSVQVLQQLHSDLSNDAAASTLEELLRGRYATDVFD
ncbi:cytochrome p450 [Moniliophthora roreri MCA 2997]|uniref:Cytochrome p450 n=1 Tax=Moniliophthora roreri (strain MCA 2997) TaxID=1381753 RepID=V2WX65_MONRO|nr:cytochrome p450 [Moniliophthora roreri MCA 2997]